MNYIIMPTDNNELMHYGVLGMKWGQRRARKYAEKAASASNKREAAAYQAKANRIRTTHTRRAGGKAAYNYTKKQSVGKTALKSMIMGTYGTLKYNEARSKGTDRGKAFVRGVLYGSVNKVTAGAMSVVEPRIRK